MDESIDVQGALDFAKQANGKETSVQKDGSINLDNYEHGEVIDVDGKPGIVIDREKHLRDIAERDTELNMVKALLDPNDPTFDGLDPAIKDPEAIKEIQKATDKFLNENPEAQMKRMEVKKAFAGWEIGGGGLLVPANDPRAKMYAEAMAKIRSGEIRLPTVEEYDRQEREAKKKQKELAQRRIQAQSQPEVQPEVREEVMQEPVETSEVSYLPKKEKMEEMNMSAEEREKIIQSAQTDPMMEAINAQNAAKGEKQKTPPEGKVEEKTQEAPESVPATAPQPINLFEVQEQLESMREEKVQQAAAPVVQKEKEPDVVINVPEGRADTFMETLLPRTEAKIETARKIKVVFTKNLELPKVTRKIADIDGYRSVAPKNVSADIVPRVLINSGYIGYFKPCGALKWSRLAPPVVNGEFQDMDEAKMIQFCYEQLATTSIGNLGYRQFLENTSIDDLQSMLHAIMGASLPDEQEVMLTCGNCEKEFETKYHISELPDYDVMADDTKEQVQKIQNAKDMIEDARDVHDESPVMQVCAFEATSTGSVFIIKHADLTTTIDRQAVSEYLRERYGASASLLSVVITEVRINLNGEWSSSNDPTVICEELLRLSKGDLDAMKAIVDEIPMITPITYSFKGGRTCSNCGQELTHLRQNITSLVFQIALRAQYFV